MSMTGVRCNNWGKNHDSYLRRNTLVEVYRSINGILDEERLQNDLDAY